MTELIKCECGEQLKIIKNEMKEITKRFGESHRVYMASADDFNALNTKIDELGKLAEAIEAWNRREGEK